DDPPPQWTHALGGDEGFPGLHLGEQRGSREVYGALRIGRVLAGPVEVRLLVAGGRAWTPGAVPNDWVAGARLGFGADTPAGPIAGAHGVTPTGPPALLLRPGH